MGELGRILVVGWLAWSSLGCTSSAGTIFEPVQYPRRSIHARISEVRVRDNRLATKEQTFDTPIVSMPGQDEHRPVQLTPATVAEMERRLGQLVFGGPRQIAADIAVVDGHAGWKASWTSETAYARVQLIVDFKDASTGAKLATAFGEAWGSRSSMDVSDGEPSELFQAAVLAAFDRAVTNPVTTGVLSSASAQSRESRRGFKARRVRDGSDRAEAKFLGR